MNLRQKKMAEENMCLYSLIYFSELELKCWENMENVVYQ